MLEKVLAILKIFHVITFYIFFKVFLLWNASLKYFNHENCVPQKDELKYWVRTYACFFTLPLVLHGLSMVQLFYTFPIKSLFPVTYDTLEFEIHIDIG